MQRYDTILLDADNTLFDFDLAEHKALTLALTPNGIPCTAKCEALYVNLNRALWAKYDRGEIGQEVLAVERFASLLHALGRTGDPAALNRAYLTRLGEQADLLPGADAFCRRLLPNCTLAIVTNGLSLAQRGRVGRSTIGDCFQGLYISQELGVQKPQRAFFDVVLADMGVTDRSHTVIVGDTLGSDILGGQNAGIDTIWYNPRGLPGKPEIFPTRICANFDEISDFILYSDNDIIAGPISQQI